MNKKQKIGVRHKSLGASFFRSRGSVQHKASAQRLASSAALASSRRGILLLVVLSMLTLFLMIGTAYLVTSNQYRRAQEEYARATQESNAPAKQGHLLNEVINQLLRDTNNQFSNLRYHSLLRDVYGNDGFTAELANSAGNGCIWAGNSKAITGGQMLDLQLNGTVGLKDYLGNTAPLSSLSTNNNAYNGLVLTFLDGPARGQSTRIVGYIYNGTNNIFRILTPQLANGQPVADPTLLAESRIAINGRPFNGTGVGYNLAAPAGSAQLNAVEPVMVDGTPVDIPIALLPNAAFFDIDPDETKSKVNPLYYGLFGAGSVPLNRRIYSGQGGSDESYDIPDFQNMALGMLPLNAVETVFPDVTAGAGPSNLGNMILPSFHRPALLNYWEQQLINAGSLLADEPTLLRKVLLRPNWLDHPKFSGSNPDYQRTLSAVQAGTSPYTTEDLLDHMIYGPWDVDNDNDGIRDSVWIDFGASVMEGPDGRMVKPLAAILVLDMDGRLNLNAHGTRDIAGINFLPTPQPIANATMSSILPSGEGYGPADISLESVVSDPTNASNPSYFDELLAGGPGPDGTPGTTDDIPGRYGIGGVPGQANTFGLKAQLKMQGIPRTFDGRLADGSTLGSYATLPDLSGRYAVGLNDLGQPVYESVTDTMPLDRNTPYELDLSTNGSRGSSPTTGDGAFSVAEMERILRAYDVDAGNLPPRLWELAGQFKSDGTTTNIAELNQWRTLLTTDSYDMPVPNSVLPEWVKNGLDGVAGNADDFLFVMGKPPVRASFADLLEYRLRVGGVAPANIPREMSKLLAPDLADGLRLDINRAIGNGRDDNGNGVVDEPGENEDAYWTIDNNGGVTPVSIAMSNFINDAGKIQDAIDRNDDGTITAQERGDTNNDGTVDASDDPIVRAEIHNFRRQLLARHLYVMAMALVDPPPAAMTVADRNKRARRLAQWAINVVDFRDPDNCMTAFEYDSDPFDGWDNAIDGIPDPTYPAANQRQLVWGAERPELLITETLAWHDRRTTDETAGVESSNFVNGQAEKAALVTDPPSTPPDQDFDQLYRPRGAAFIELYAPYPASPAANADTHDKDVNGNDLGINLSAVDQVTGTSPVWRIAVYQRPANITPLECADWDPDAPDQADHPQTMMDRCIYLARMPDTTIAAASLQAINASENATTPVIEYFTTLPVPTVRPGRFLVIGSGIEVDASGNKQVGTGIYASEIGDIDPTKGGTIRRRIELNINNPTTPLKFVEPNNTSNLNGNETAFIDPDAPGRAICDVAVITHAVVSGASYQRRFTFTEPAKGYPGDPGVPTTGPAYYDDPVKEGRYGNIAQAAAYDTPHDDNRRIQLRDGRLVPDTRLMLPTSTTAQRIVESYSMVYLQRLANPLLPFDKLTNPYRTIDTMSVNVPVFNGAPGAEASQGVPGEKRFNGTVQVHYPNTKATRHFASLQRGYTANPLDAFGKNIRNPVAPNIFGNEPPSAFVGQFTAYQAPPPIGIYDRGFAPTGNTIDVIPDFTLGAVNHTSLSLTDAERNELISRDAARIAATNIDGLIDGLTPREPYPWLTWNNRPYISGNELMLVPRSRSSQLLREFSGQINNSANPYDASDVPVKNQTVNNRPAYIQQSSQGPFGHLPNMYLSETPSAAKLPDVVAGLSRVLEYIQVPSRFVGTETWLNPATFGQQISDATDARMNRQPPFNRISSYREPGRVNLNTIVNGDVWDGGLLHRRLAVPGDPWDPITNNYQQIPPPGQRQWHEGPLFVDTVNGKQGILESRRGYAGLNPSLDNSMLPLDPNVPTFFANPFRSPDAGNLVPLLQMRRRGTDCQLMRSDKLPQITQSGGMLDPTLTGATPTELEPSNTPLMAGNTPGAGNEYRDTDRNPYFRFQPMTRLSNLTTTRSNVYAIWVTIGFFEVEEADDWATNENNVQNRFNNDRNLYNKVYPEGYTLGQEAGSETGDIRRIREFAIIDRTIPVGFEPGKNHNVERAVRLRRRIE